ncbi:MAG: hypothetical protein E6K68_00710 [Nitrospirae bacterium]|nr:MAG: hypothetical protein E6K68_00710 [Nitrospirota bacterium]
MMARCCCGALLEAKALEEESPLSYHLRLGCTACANWVTVSGRLEEITPLVERFLWSNEARHELERLPPYIGPLVRTEVESYAAQTGSRVITVAVLHEARNRGKVVWAPAAKDRLANIPAPIRSMAKVEIERMALAQGLSEVTEALMDEAKAKFLGMRGRP